jgi:hypothetical protein
VSPAPASAADHRRIGNTGQDEVIRLRTRYIIELEQMPDDRVEGTLHRDGLPEPVPFSGWTELLSLLEPPPRAVPEAAVSRSGQHQTDGNGRPHGLPRPF